MEISIFIFPPFFLPRLWLVGGFPPLPLPLPRHLFIFKKESCPSTPMFVVMIMVVIMVGPPCVRSSLRRPRLVLMLMLILFLTLT